MIKLFLFIVAIFSISYADEVNPFSEGICFHEYFIKNDPFIALEYKLTDVDLLKKKNYKITLERIEKDKKMFIFEIFSPYEISLNIKHNIFYVNKDDFHAWFFRIQKKDNEKDNKLIPLGTVLKMSSLKRTEIKDPPVESRGENSAQK